MIRAYEEIIDFIASGTSSRKVASFQPSEETLERVMDLLAQEKEHQLSPEDAAELGHYLQIEHLMRLAKARALQYLADDQLH